MSYSDNPIESVGKMVRYFGFTETEVTPEVVNYRIDRLTEEYNEIITAHSEWDAEELVDGHIDLIVIALGNLAIFGVDTATAFDQVLAANMNKVRGKRRDSDPEGVSMCKPPGWEGPDHSDNHGVLDEVYQT